MPAPTANADTFGDQFVNANTGLCLSIRNASRAVGAVAIEQTCDFTGDSPVQQWRLG